MPSVEGSTKAKGLSMGSSGAGPLFAGSYHRFDEVIRRPFDSRSSTVAFLPSRRPGMRLQPMYSTAVHLSVSRNSAWSSVLDFSVRISAGTRWRRAPPSARRKKPEPTTSTRV